MILVGLILAGALAAGCDASVEKEVQATYDHSWVGVDVSNDGKLLVFSCSYSNLWIKDLETGKVRPVTEDDRSYYSPSFSPDGKWILAQRSVSVDSPLDIVLVSSDGKTIRTLTKPQAEADWRPVFSPDGKTAIFARSSGIVIENGAWRYDDFDLYEVGLDGSGLRRLTRERANNVQGIAVAANGDVVHSIAWLDWTKGASLRRLGENGSREFKSQGQAGALNIRFHNSWWMNALDNASGGEWMAYAHDSSAFGDVEIRVSKLDGSDSRRVGSLSVGEFADKPTISEDGKAIYFLVAEAWDSDRAPTHALYQGFLDGKKPRRIAGPELFEYPEEWNEAASAAPPQKRG